jgi:hypothetical protein
LASGELVHVVPVTPVAAALNPAVDDVVDCWTV